MDHSFSKRVHNAAIAGWWTLLIGIGFVTVVWFAFLGLMHCGRAGCCRCMGRRSPGQRLKRCRNGS